MLSFTNLDLYKKILRETGAITSLFELKKEVAVGEFFYRAEILWGGESTKVKLHEHLMPRREEIPEKFTKADFYEKTPCFLNKAEVEKFQSRIRSNWQALTTQSAVAA